jgi:hypothetical protein
MRVRLRYLWARCWHHTTLVRALEIPFGFCGRPTPRYLPFVGGKQRIGEHAITTSEAWFTIVVPLMLSRGREGCHQDWESCDWLSTVFE